MKGTGEVMLIGAGPGDPQLLTLKAVAGIQAADVLVYDRLLGEGILAWARNDAARIYVGKEPDCHAVNQAEINQILVREAQAGKRVARVKGGDPFLFGRGGEEAEVLAEAGIPFEIVPGVSAALAVPAYAGIPVTHRDFGAAVHIITGHEASGRRESRLDFAKLAALEGTLVFLMGMRNLPQIATSLITYGKDPATRVAVIEKGTTAAQRVVTGSLAEIAERVEQAQVGSPAVIVIGAVVNLREQLQWFPRRGPLTGRTIVVTRAREQASELVKRLRELGGEVVEFPLLKILPPDETDLQRLDQALEGIEGYTWLVFTSVNGVKAFWARWQERQMDLRRLAGVQIAVVGPATRDELRKLGLQADLMPDSYTTIQLTADLLTKTGPQDRFLLLRSDLANETLPAGLAQAGIPCDDLVAYRTAAEQMEPQALQRLHTGRIDYLTFTSASTVQHFKVFFPEEIRDNQLPKVVCIGPVTAAAAAQSGLKVTAQADEFTIDGLVAKIVELEGGGSDVAKATPVEKQ